MLLEHWKTIFLVSVIALSLVYYLYCLSRSTKREQMTRPIMLILSVAIPAAGVISFYWFDWRVAVGIIVAGRFAWRYAGRAINSLRFPEAPAGESGAFALRAVASIFYGVVIAANSPDLLRLFPVIAAVLNFVEMSHRKGNKEHGVDGIMKVTALLAAGMMYLSLAVISEFIWWVGSFETWIWLFAFWQAGAIAALGILLIPFAAWIHAGEPGRNRP